MDDVIEFYDGNKLIVGLKSNMVPPVGSFINIRKVTWTVVSVTYTVDYADGPCSYMRANVDLKKGMNEI